MVGLAALFLVGDVAVAVSGFRAGNVYAFNDLFVRSLGGPLVRRELRG